jgi:hypothetical protein
MNGHSSMRPNISVGSTVGPFVEALRSLAVLPTFDKAALSKTALAAADAIEQAMVTLQAVENILRTLAEPIIGTDALRRLPTQVHTTRLIGDIPGKLIVGEIPAPTITDFTNAQHDHSSAAEGGKPIGPLWMTPPIGVGVASPANNFHVEGGRIIHTFLGAATAQMFAFASGCYFGSLSNHPVIFRTNDSDCATITTGGFVGIGLSDPLGKLHVLGPDAPYTDPTADFYVSGGSRLHQIRFGYDSSNSRGWIQSVFEGVTVTPLILNGNGGNVGVGKIPAYRIDVAGDCNLSDGSVYRVNGVPVGFTTQSVVTALRAIGTTYQNTSGKPMLVSVTLSFPGSANVAALTDTANPPSTVVASFQNSAATTFIQTLTFLVLNGNYYNVANVVAGAAKIYWIEWT